jgi:hypothetical protein
MKCVTKPAVPWEAFPAQAKSCRETGGSAPLRTKYFLPPL